MVHFGLNRQLSAFLPVAALLWTNINFAAGQAAYPNPFAPPPAPIAPPPTPAPVAQPKPDAYPNPFAPPPAPVAQPDPNAYPNPFAPKPAPVPQPNPDTYPNPFNNNNGQVPINENHVVDPDQAWADQICHSDPAFGPSYIGARDANGVWACVLAPQSNKPQPCFGTYFMDPTTGKPACRPKPAVNNCGLPTCTGGQVYQKLDPAAPTGACCGKGVKYECSCKDGGSYVYDPLSCPVLHRNIRITPNGPKFNLFCNISTKRKEIKVEPGKSFIECVDACGALSGCAGVEFHRLKKECSFKSEFLDENTEGAENNDVDSASMDPPPQCPDADGQTLTIGGVDYQLYCTTGWSTALPHSETTIAENIYDCTRQCTERGAACQGANFWFANQGCVMTSAHEYPPTGGDGKGAVVGAIPKKKK